MPARAEANPANVRWYWPIAVALVIVSVVYAFWWIPTRVRPWNDFAFVYAAGRSWLAGVSPYNFDRWNAEWAAIRPPETHVAQPMPFMYPPHWGPIAALMALLPWPVAMRVWDAVNVLTYLGACIFSAKLVGVELQALARQPSVWLVLAIATLNPALRYSIFQSQMAIFSTFGVVGAFWAWHEKRKVWLAVFAFIASLKPQVGVLPLLYVFLNGGHAGVLWAAAAALITGFLSMVPTDLARFPADIADNYLLHKRLDFNQPNEFSSLPALTAGYLSADMFMLIGPVLATVLVSVMTWMRRRGTAPAVFDDPLWQLSLVMAATGALMPVHGYDLVIYTPLAFLAYRLKSTPTVLLLAGLIVMHRRLPLPAAFLTGGIAAVVVVAACRYRDGRLGFVNSRR